MSRFGFEVEAEPPPRPVTRRRPLLLLGVLVLLLAAILGGGGYAVSRLVAGPSSSNYPGPGFGSVRVQVLSGDTATAIADRLAAAGVVRTAGAFVNAADANPASEGIEPGFYQLRMHMSAREALAILIDPANMLHATVTVPEGTSLKVLLPLISKATGISLSSLQQASADPAALGLPAYAQSHVEGFLFPATYDVPPGTTAVQMLRLMVARFGQAAAAVNLVSGAAALNLTPLQVVIIASILEGESASPADDPKVAEVFYNRLRAGMPLGSEFTEAYSGDNAASPYNTYTHTGFPPGAYDSPGQVALEAALHPVPGPWLYFVTLPHGGTVFSSTYAGFAQAQQECLDQGGCRG